MIFSTRKGGSLLGEVALWRAFGSAAGWQFDRSVVRPADISPSASGRLSLEFLFATGCCAVPRRGRVVPKSKIPIPGAVSGTSKWEIPDKRLDQQSTREE